ncbi:unnamed protein product [Protopolystoma xenopodis]|uniref:EGF-like domain-containing protein n=1 Tax=Protopolystoma xenopodis TaxID=117903 RepID=A0A448XF46_9PLAT|nr:unnamed protein product [Protopolystoma xenopodis]
MISAIWRTKTQHVFTGIEGDCLENSVSMNPSVKQTDNWARGIRRRLLVEPTFESFHPILSLEIVVNSTSYFYPGSVLNSYSQLGYVVKATKLNAPCPNSSAIVVMIILNVDPWTCIVDSTTVNENALPPPYRHPGTIQVVRDWRARSDSPGAVCQPETGKCVCPTGWAGIFCTEMRGEVIPGSWTAWSNCKPECYWPRSSMAWKGQKGAARAGGLRSRVGRMSRKAQCNSPDSSNFCSGQLKTWSLCHVKKPCRSRNDAFDHASIGPEQSQFAEVSLQQEAVS